MNNPIFLFSMVGEDPQDFIDGVYKVLSAMGVTSMEEVELASSKMKYAKQVWYT